jgi:uncharacterized protein (TIGR02594 family)
MNTMQNYVVTANLTMRNGPGTGHKSIGYLLKNSIVQGDQTRDAWVHVTDSTGRSGWSSGKYLQALEAPNPEPAPGETQDPELGTYVVTAAGALNLRKGPGKNYPISGALYGEETVEALSESLDGQWLQVRKFNGLSGWSSKKYLSRLVNPIPASDTELIVTADRVNLRRGPGSGHAIVGKVGKGEVVKLMHTSPNWSWYQVQKDKLTDGWCAAKYLIEREMLTIHAEDLTATGKHRVATYTLNLREGPRLETRSLGTLNFNQVVEVDAISADGLWKHCAIAEGLSGWCMSVHLAHLGELSLPAASEEFPWMPIAFSELGTGEIPGKGSNPKILDYLASTDLFKYPYLPDETNWCAAFLNWCIKKSGTLSANSALAFPWSKWGKALQTPRRGCIVAFQWDDGGHHVSFYLSAISNYVIALGGNQNDAVWISIYHKRHVLGYRVPADWPESPPA